jgi:hypothetical protein
LPWDGATPAHGAVALDALRRSTAGARRSAWRAALLLEPGCIVVRRYVGALAGSEGREPIRLVYVGHEEYAREFEIYLRQEVAEGVRPEATLFRGNLPHYLVARSGLRPLLEDADVVAHEAFPGAATHPDDILHYPMLDASLRVELDLRRQLRRLRSRGLRRLAREVLARRAYRAWLEPGLPALERFRVELYEPFVRRRFGAWGMLDAPETLRALHAHGGTVLFVARRDQPDVPVCGAQLFTARPGVLAYHVNGFAADAPHLAAERTAALELALFEAAIAARFERIDLGYTRAVLNDGLFVHKRRLGCSFSPVAGSPAFRIRVRDRRRASVFSRLPLLTGEPGQWSAILGFDDSGPRLRGRAWRGELKSYRALQLTRAAVWTNACAARCADPVGEAGFLAALTEAIDPDEGIHVRVDGGARCRSCLVQARRAAGAATPASADPLVA